MESSTKTYLTIQIYIFMEMSSPTRSYMRDLVVNMAWYMSKPEPFEAWQIGTDKPVWIANAFEEEIIYWRDSGLWAIPSRCVDSDIHGRTGDYVIRMSPRLFKIEMQDNFERKYEKCSFKERSWLW